VRAVPAVALAFLILSGSAASAATVMVMSLGPGRAELLVNGTEVRKLHEGESSPEGVLLVSATPQAAVIEADGRRHTLNLGQSTASSVVLKATAGGIFLTTAHINGVPIQVIVDTGASTVALNRIDAGRVGIDFATARQISYVTANGPATASAVTLTSVQIGDILVSNVPAAVLLGGAEQLPVVLLGSTFLQHVDIQRSGDTLTITKRW
jgi:aspartyl protease family protein